MRNTHLQRIEEEGASSTRSQVGTWTDYTLTDADNQSDDEEEIELVNREYGVKRIFIESFFSSPMAIRVSLTKHGQIEDEKALEEIAFVKKIANIGLSVMSLENTPLTVNAFEVENVYGDLADISERFKLYYKQQLKANTLSLFGGSNLIGNPTGLIDTVGSGFRDFYYEPAKGF